MIKEFIKNSFKKFQIYMSSYKCFAFIYNTVTIEKRVKARKKTTVTFKLFLRPHRLVGIIERISTHAQSGPCLMHLHNFISIVGLLFCLCCTFAFSPRLQFVNAIK